MKMITKKQALEKVDKCIKEESKYYKLYSPVDKNSKIQKEKTQKEKEVLINLTSEYPKFVNNVNKLKSNIIKHRKYLEKFFIKLNKNRKFCKTCSSCCCVECSNNFGYLTMRFLPEEGIFLVLFEDEIKEAIKKYWNSKKGFLGKKGCKLPYYLRSFTCVEYVCQKIKSSTETKFSIDSKDLRNTNLFNEEWNHVLRSNPLQKGYNFFDFINNLEKLLFVIKNNREK